MNALVTGATGFVGGHLVDRLLQRGDRVTALVRSRERAAPLAARGVALVQGDLAHDAALHEAVAGQHVIYHAAAQLGAATEAELMAANRDGTHRLARASAAAADPPRFVMISSLAAGGPAHRGAPKASPGDDHPVTMYGRSKLAAELALAGCALPWCILRPPVVYGPRDREGFLPLFRAVSWGLAPTFGDGAMEVSLVHVADLADAIVLAGVTGGIEHRTFHVNHPEVVTGAELIRAIAEVLGRRPVRIAIPRWGASVALAVTGAWAGLTRRKSILHPDKIHEFYQEAWTADPTPFIDATGWRPAISLETGLVDTAASYRQAGWL